MSAAQGFAYELQGNVLKERRVGHYRIKYLISFNKKGMVITGKSRNKLDQTSFLKWEYQLPLVVQEALGGRSRHCASELKLLLTCVRVSGLNIGNTNSRSLLIKPLRKNYSPSISRRMPRYVVSAKRHPAFCLSVAAVLLTMLHTATVASLAEVMDGRGQAVGGGTGLLDGSSWALGGDVMDGASGRNTGITRLQRRSLQQTGTTAVIVLPSVPISGAVQNLLSANSLYAVKYAGTSATEVHVTTASSNYNRFSLQTPTALPITSPATWKFMLGSNEDIYAVNLTEIRKPELLVLSRTSSYRSVSLRATIGIPSGIITNPTAVQFDLGTNDDLYLAGCAFRGTKCIGRCISAFSCLTNTFNSSQLLQNPFSLIGGGSIYTGSGYLFDDLPIGPLVEIPRRLSSTAQLCPFLTLTGSQIDMLAWSINGNVGGLNPSRLGSVYMAFVAINDFLTSSMPYVVGFIAPYFYISTIRGCL
ncbi:hypothetical protein VOLCADRAFT_94609 [Volvox carteri f. nagariensis]|uniref:Uncharacterized protein n=1 Tax=Volvox carteri f. nagariensis TaxID=3068 RepID=D8U589_VOLCA|nr:uncharacterized protein VOLCADRAFT_94609 [Volvox carteri f. nagariensis]EFJ45170.1 hypothetical protein VOLCADRAFT_94609 [Volvox carteri f. nagariensis]|eukprot:XP_002953846.1 hypothetical protein VOLCADRAFT_94609 [Volvox carteri f. nagariensis]